MDESDLGFSEVSATGTKNTLDKHNNLDSDLDQHGNTSGPQFASTTPAGPVVQQNPLTLEALAPIVAESLLRWQSAGAMLSADDFQVIIADLADESTDQLPLLGYTDGTTIVIDINGGGFGWFIDPTPSDDTEFDSVFVGFGLAATPESLASGRMDLLTVVMHELGHVLGLQSLEPGESPSNLMAPTLPAGTRRLPGPASSGGSNVLHNALLPADVNGDGVVTPLDALLVLNSIRQSRIGGASESASRGSVFFGDVNGDGKITPLDALLVLNSIGRNQRAERANALARFSALPPEAAGVAADQPTAELLSLDESPADDFRSTAAEAPAARVTAGYLDIDDEGDDKSDDALLSLLADDVAPLWH